MSYGFDLVRLPQGADKNEAYKKQSESKEKKMCQESGDPGEINPLKEQTKQRLADLLMTRHPSLELFQRDYLGLAKSRLIDVSEAQRLFRNLELNERRYLIQILLFDDEAGATFSFAGPPEECAAGLRLLWDCLKILESEAGFSTYDPQVAKILDLSSDFDLVLKNACGRRAQ